MHGEFCKINNLLRPVFTSDILIYTVWQIFFSTNADHFISISLFRKALFAECSESFID